MCNTYERPKFDKTVPLADNAMLRHKSELFNEWNFEKNNELGLKVYEVTKGSGKKAWWTCHKCNSDYDTRIIGRVKGTGCPYCTGQKVNHTNSLASVNPELSKQWNYDKNKDINPNNVTCGSTKKAWWKCDNGHEWEAVIGSRDNGNGCPYCAGLMATVEDNLEIEFPKIALEWNYDKNKRSPNEFKSKSNKKVWWVCELGHEWEASICNRTDKKSGCPYCSTFSQKGHSLVIKHFNDMWTTNPLQASWLLNPDDGYKYTQNSGKKVDWKCPDCGEIIINRRIHDINKQGIPCPRCKDGMSFGERTMYYLLKDLGLEFVFDRKTEWSNNRKYDFYLPKYNCIIEIHGQQHYIENSRKGARSLIEEQENDVYKRKLALKNGINKYIEIDCRKSDFEFIKSSIINSDIKEFLNLKNVNWYNIKKKSYKKITKDIALLYKQGLNINEIIDNTGFGYAAIKNQLLLSFDLELCHRNVGDENLFITLKKRVIQLDRNLNYIKTWESVNDATFTITGTRSGKISKACKEMKGIVYGFRWLYEDDYIQFKNGKIKLEKSNKLPSKIIQLTMNMEYIREWSSPSLVKKSLKLSSSSGIYSCCKKDQEYAFGYKWMYKEDYEKYIEEQKQLA